MLDIPFCVAGGIRTRRGRGRRARGRRREGLGQFARPRRSRADRAARAALRLAMRRGRHRQPAATEANTACRQYTGDPHRASVPPAASTLEWVREVQDRGAGEIVLNCMASDGVRQGYDLAQLAAVRAVCRVPLVASGGAGAARAFRRGVFAGGRRRRAGGERVSLGRHRDTCTQALPARPRHRGATMKLRLETLDWEQARRTAAGGRAGRAQRQGADARLHEREALRADADGAPGHLLQPQPATAVDQGRDLRKFPDRRRRGHGLRLGRAAGAGRARGTDLPQGHRVLLRRGRPDDQPRVSPSCRRSRGSSRGGSRSARTAATPRACTAKGPDGIAQKVGEEGVELALAAVSRDDDAVLAESADLLYHLLLLLKSRGLSLARAVAELSHVTRTRRILSRRPDPEGRCAGARPWSCRPSPARGRRGRDARPCARRSRAPSRR